MYIDRCDCIFSTSVYLSNVASGHFWATLSMHISGILVAKLRAHVFPSNQSVVCDTQLSGTYDTLVARGRVMFVTAAVKPAEGDDVITVPCGHMFYSIPDPSWPNARNAEI